MSEEEEGGEGEEAEMEPSASEEIGRVVHVSPVHDLLGKAFGWTPFQKYSRRRSSHIEMLDHQYFIPPPDEGTSLFESLAYNCNEHGNDFVIWIYQVSFYTVVSCGDVLRSCHMMKAVLIEG